MTFTVPGTPEQIWNAIATGTGLSAWFARTDLEPREGGAIAFHLGGDVISKATITAYHPLQRFAYVEHDWEPGAPPLATAFTIETGGNDGEPCKVHVIQTVDPDSGQWTGQLASMEGGWTAMFGVLDLYLTDFAGDRAVCIRPTVPFAGHLDAASSRLEAAIARDYASAIVRQSATASNRDTLLRLVRDEGSVALLSAYQWAGQVNLVACVYFYGEGGQGAAQRAEPYWRNWLEDVAAAASGAGTGT